MDVLIDRPEFSRPPPLELAVLVAPDLASDLPVELEVLRLLARDERVGAQLVDHGRLLSGTALAVGSMRRVDRVVLAQRMPFPLLSQTDAVQVGMAAEDAAEHVVALALDRKSVVEEKQE